MNNNYNSIDINNYIKNNLTTEEREVFAGFENIGSSQGRIYKIMGNDGNYNFFRGTTHSRPVYKTAKQEALNANDILILSGKVQKWIGSKQENVSSQARVAICFNKIVQEIAREHKEIDANSLNFITKEPYRSLVINIAENLNKRPMTKDEVALLKQVAQMPEALQNQFPAIVKEAVQHLEKGLGQQLAAIRDKTRSFTGIPVKDIQRKKVKTDEEIALIKNAIEAKKELQKEFGSKLNLESFRHEYQGLDHLLRLATFDPEFLCNTALFNQASSDWLNQQLVQSEDFDASLFLKGAGGYNLKSFVLKGPEGGSPEKNRRARNITKKNDEILKQASAELRQQAKQLANERKISLDQAYKLLIGILDRYDQTARPPQSTFALRTALLLANQAEGGKLDSWMFFTKQGKLADDYKWDFLDLKNFVPEAQGAMLKFTEAAFVKAIELGRSRQTNEAIFLKGGFGAGKTRLAGILLGEEKREGVFAPDTAKRIVRRASPTVPHSIAHIQGSQLAYLLFDEMIKKEQIGTIAYDSSLARPSDVQGYLNKSKKAKRKMVIHDIARNDMARILAILRRDVKGDDPRIPPDFIINSAILDKMNRAKCMQIILNDKTEDNQLRPEYHFHGANAKGWDTQELMVLKSNHEVNFLHPEAQERLSLEGIAYHPDSKKFELAIDETTVRQQFHDQMEKPVKEIMTQLSADENQLFQASFGRRTFHLDFSKGPITSAEALYQALPEKVKSAISPSAFQSAFSSIKPETATAFFGSLTGRSSFSYLDLPLRAALIIHQNLSADPWL